MLTVELVQPALAPSAGNGLIQIPGCIRDCTVAHPMPWALHTCQPILLAKHAERDYDAPSEPCERPFQNQATIVFHKEHGIIRIDDSPTS